MCMILAGGNEDGEFLMLGVLLQPRQLFKIFEHTINQTTMNQLKTPSVCPAFPLWSLPTQKTKVRIIVISPGGDKFGGGFPGHGIEQEILHRCEKGLRGLIRFVIVTAQSKKIAHLLVEAFLRGSDVPDTLQHFIEVIRSAVRVPKPLVIQSESLEHVFLQNRGGPAAELHATRRAHPVAHGQNGVEVVERQGALDLASLRFELSRIP